MAIYREAHLFYKDHRSNKEYHLTLETLGIGQFRVMAKFGPRGGTLTHVDKTHGYTNYDTAVAVYNKTYAEKTSKGYKLMDDLQDRIAKAADIFGYQLTSQQWKKLVQFVKDYAEECA